MKEKFEHQSADGDFNHDFMQQMVKDHESAVELFQTAANDTTLDPDLRALTALPDKGQPGRVYS